MSLSCVTDLRGRPKWTPADLARKADLWIVADSWGERPPVEGRILAYTNPAILLKDGKPYSEPNSFNSALWGIPMLNMKPLWVSDDGVQVLQALDITARGALRQFMAAFQTHVPWADGVNVCYFTSLDWHDPGVYSIEFWEKWDNVLSAMGNAFMDIRPGFLCLAQQFHVTSPTMNTNGLYLEGGPYEFRYSPAKHAQELSLMREMLHRVDPTREVVWVQEVRNPGLYSTSDLSAILNWAEINGIYVSLGRDATARGEITIETV